VVADMLRTSVSYNKKGFAGRSWLIHALANC
jgi:hypothetical protein